MKTINLNDISKNWSYYLSNKDYCSIYWADGRNFSYYKDSQFYPLVYFPEDFLGAYQKGVYIKINNKFFYPTFYPNNIYNADFKVKFSLGYIFYQANFKDIILNWLIFVHYKYPLEVWSVKIKNLTKRKLPVEVFFVLNPCLGPISSVLMDEKIEKLYNLYKADKKNHSFYVWKSKRPSQESPLYVKLFMEGGTPFILDLNEKFLRNKIIYGLNKGIALKKDIILKDNIKIYGSIYCTNNEKEIFNKGNKKYFLSKTEFHTKELLSFFSKFTLPDKNLEKFLNFYLPYQMINIFRHRSASPYSIGAGGFGYRDTCQDLLGIFNQGYQKNNDLCIEAEERLREIISYQYSSGKAVSGYSKVTGSWEAKGKEGVIGKSDVQLWLPLVVWKYIVETGDFNFLNEKISTLDGFNMPVWEHCYKANLYTFSNKGKNGLPLIGKADWNDALDKVGDNENGESVFNAMLLIYSSKKVIELLQLLKNKDREIRILKKIVKEMKNNILAKCWDGNWFIRAICKNGKIIGSKSNIEGKIFLNVQSWAIISGILRREKAIKLMETVEKILSTPFGYKLFAPPYTKYDKDIGRISSFAPGTKENASIFTHANLFKIYADGLLNKKDKVYEDLLKLLPQNENKPIEKYKAEPYVLAEYVISPDNKYFAGKGEFTWNTGSVPWYLINVSESLLGVKFNLDKIVLNLGLPKSLNYAFYQRKFREKLIEIYIEKKKLNEKRIFINGKLFNRNYLYYDDMKSDETKIYIEIK